MQTTEPKQPAKQQQNAQEKEEKNGLFQLQSESAFELEDNRPKTTNLLQLQGIAYNSLGADYAYQMQKIADNSPQVAYAHQMQKIVDNSPQVQYAHQMQEIVDNSPQVEYAHQMQEIADNSPQVKGTISRKENNTGLPDNLKYGIESLSGYSMDDVKVHYNSDKPAQLNAHAYAQGTEIHVASGQEKYLAHEAWHVVQQKQGRVKPTIQKKGVAINDDTVLEKEADEMGAKALQMKSNSNEPVKESGVGGNNLQFQSNTTAPTQLFLDALSPRKWVRDQLRKLDWYNFVCALIGQDIVTGTAVPSATTDVVRAGATMFGEAYLARLEENGGVEELAIWLEEQKALLPDWAILTSKFEEGVGTLSFSDLASPIKAFNDFYAPLEPEINKFLVFSENIASKILEIVKNALRQKAKEIVEENQEIYPLITVILGKDPLTDQAVPRTADNFIRGFMNLVEGGEQRYQELQESGAIQDAMNWLNNEITMLDLTWEGIKALFQQAWDSITIEDLADPVGAFMDIVNIFVEPAQRVAQFAVNVGKKVFEFIFKGAMRLVGGEDILAILERGRETFETIVSDPVGFLSNLLGAVNQGFGQFSTNILRHLQNGLVSWLTGTLTSAGITLPEQWDLKGILSLVLQVTGITYNNIREKLVKELGEETVTKIETTVEFIKDLVTQGPMMLWEKITEFVGDIKAMIFGQIKDWIGSTIVGRAVQELILLFSPVGAVIKAIQTAYRTIKYFIDKINEIMEVVNSIIDSIASIAAGDIGAAANYVEGTLAKTINPALSFLARMIGLGDVGAQVAEIIQGFRDAYIEPALDQVVQWIVRTGIQGINAVKRMIGKVINFTVGGEEHRLWIDVNGEAVDIMVASTPMTVYNKLEIWEQKLAEDDFPTDKKGIASSLIREARTLYLTTKQESEKAAHDTENTEQNERVKTLQEELKVKIAGLFEIFGEDVQDLPSPKLPLFSDNTLAGSFKAEYLDKSVLGTGTEANTHSGSLEGWEEIQAAGLTGSGENWCKMHLLSAQLGGLAVDSNLTPARSALNTAQMYNKAEKPAIEAVQIGKPIWFKVDITYQNVVVPSGDTKRYLSNIQATWGEYEDKGGTITEKNASPQVSTSVPAPDFSDMPILNLNTKPGEGRIQLAIGKDNITLRQARILATGLKRIEGNIEDSDDLQEKLLALSPSVDISAFFTKIEIAEGDEKITF